MSLSALPDLVLRHIFAMLCEIDAPAFAVGALTIEARPVRFDRCVSLAQTCRRLARAWRAFTLGRVIDHMCAVARGTQLLHTVRILFFDPTVRRELLAQPERVLDLLALTTENLASSDATPQHCVAQALRTWFGGRIPLRKSVMVLCARSGVFDDCVPGLRTASVDDLCVFGAQIAAAAWSDRDSLRASLDCIDEAFPANFRSRTEPRTGEELHAAIVGYLESGDASLVRDVFVCTPEMFGSTYDQARIARYSATDGLMAERSIRFDRVALRLRRAQALFDSRSFDSSFGYPSALFAPVLSEKSASAAQHTDEFDRALRAVREAPERVAACTLFRQFARFLHLYTKRRSVRLPHTAEPGSIVRADARLLRDSPSGARLLTGRSRFYQLFGIKMSDQGVLSAADVLVHTVGVRADGPVTAERLESVLAHSSDWMVPATDQQRVVELYDAERRVAVDQRDTVLPVEHRGAAALWSLFEDCLVGASASRVSYAVIEPPADMHLPPITVARGRRRGSGLEVRVPVAAPTHRMSAVDMARLPPRRRLEAFVAADQATGKRRRTADSSAAAPTKRGRAAETTDGSFQVRIDSDPFERGNPAGCLVSDEYGPVSTQRSSVSLSAALFGSAVHGPDAAKLEAPSRRSKAIAGIERTMFKSAPSVWFGWRPCARDYDRVVSWTADRQQRAKQTEALVDLRADVINSRSFGWQPLCGERAWCNRFYYSSLARDSVRAARLADVRPLFRPLSARFSHFVDWLAAHPDPHAALRAMSTVRGGGQ